MTLGVDQEFLKNAAAYHEIVRRWLAWGDQLQVANEYIDSILQSPVGRSLMESGGLPVEVPINGSITRPPLFLSSSPIGIQPLNQMDIAERYAMANGGEVDLRDILPEIRDLGLSHSKTDRGLIVNLRTRLLATGDWEKIQLYRLRLKSFSSADCVLQDSAPAGFEGEKAGEPEVNALDGPANILPPESVVHADGLEEC